MCCTITFTINVTLFRYSKERDMRPFQVHKTSEKSWQLSFNFTVYCQSVNDLKLVFSSIWSIHIRKKLRTEPYYSISNIIRFNSSQTLCRYLTLTLDQKGLHVVQICFVCYVRFYIAVLDESSLLKKYSNQPHIITSTSYVKRLKTSNIVHSIIWSV